MIGVAFGAVALITIEWPRAFRGLLGDEPIGGLRAFLILAIPTSFTIDSQICSLGLKNCSTPCNVISFTMISLGGVTAVQLCRGKSVGALLAPMVVIGLLPHCTNWTPINTIFHNLLGGYSPTCQVSRWQLPCLQFQH